MTTPIDLIKLWLEEEQNAGAPDAMHAVLSTATLNAIPHGRVVAIREINEDGLLFFTVRSTRKAAELNANPIATMTFWMELFKREVIVEGEALALTDDEVAIYWASIPLERQIRFSSYASTSSQPIESKAVLENKRKILESEFKDLKSLPVNPQYCGFRIKPSRVMFYSSRADELSDVFEYRYADGQWIKQWLSP